MGGDQHIYRKSLCQMVGSLGSFAELIAFIKGKKLTGFIWLIKIGRIHSFVIRRSSFQMVDLVVNFEFLVLN